MWEVQYLLYKVLSERTLKEYGNSWILQAYSPWSLSGNQKVLPNMCIYFVVVQRRNYLIISIKICKELYLHITI